MAYAVKKSPPQGSSFVTKEEGEFSSFYIMLGADGILSQWELMHCDRSPSWQEIERCLDTNEVPSNE